MGKSSSSESDIGDGMLRRSFVLAMMDIWRGGWQGPFSLHEIVMVALQLQTDVGRRGFHVSLSLEKAGVT